MIGIYKITNPKNKIYIGQTIDYNRRFKEYLKLNNCKSQIKLFNSFNKYGVENHIFEIIEECDIEKLNERERYYQDLYNVLSDKGLNLKLTSFDDKFGILSEEIKYKISNSMEGKIKSKNTKLKISKSMIGRKHTKNTCEKMSKSRKGLIYNTNRTIIKPVYQYDLNLNLIKIWDSFNDITKDYFKSKNNIWNCLINKHKTCLKFYWSFIKL